MEVSYGAVTFQNVKTRDFRQEATYSDDRVDFLFMHFYIDIQATVSPFTMSYTADKNGNPQAEAEISPALTTASIRQYLMTPRRKLSCNVDSNRLLESPPDVNFGPKPISVNVVEIIGSNAFLVDFRIECWTNDCPNQTVPILSNRWQQTHQIDEQFQTTITTSGMAVFSTAILATKAADANLPDFYRNAVIPPCRTGYRRVDVQVNADSDGRMLRYQITDREMFYSLGNTMASRGSRVVKFESVLELATINPTEAGAASLTVQKTCHVKVWGDQYSRKWHLTLFAFLIIADKMEIEDKTPENAICRNVNVKHYLHDRLVEVTYVCMIPPLTSDKGGDGPKTAITFGNLRNRDEFLRINNNPTMEPAKGLGVIDPGGFNQAAQGKNPIPTGPILADNMTRGPDPFSNSGNLSPKKPQYYLQTAAISKACTPPPSQLDDMAKAFAVKGFQEDLPPSGPYVSSSGAVTIAGDNGVATNVPTVTVAPWLNTLTFTPTPNYAVATAQFHTDYKLEMSYMVDYHVLQLPTTGGSDVRRSAAYAQTAQPTSNRIIKWTAERVRQEPTLPNPVLTDPNWVLYDTKIIPLATTILQDGTPVYRTSGVYCYYAQSYQGAGDALYTGVMPWTTLNYNQNQIKTTDYSHGLIDSAPTTVSVAAYIAGRDY